MLQFLDLALVEIAPFASDLVWLFGVPSRFERRGRFLTVRRGATSRLEPVR